MLRKRLFAWITILVIPLSYIISILLSIVNHPFATTFLAITLLSTITGPMTIYAFTIFPVHMAEIGMKALQFHNEHNHNYRLSR